MDTSIFKYGELPQFKKFTPEIINKQFPVVLEKITEEFKNIEKNLSNYLIQNDLNWDKVINPLNEVNEILRWSWGVISHLNSVNNSESLRDIYSKFLPEIISLNNKFGQSKIIYNSLVKLKEINNFDQIKNRILDKEILEMQHRGISLQKNDQEEFNNISEKLGKLSTDFSNNVLDATKCNGTSNCHNGKKCSTHDLWHELNNIVEDYLEKITINSLVETYDSPYIKFKEIN